jgi:hypothetical protein
VKIVNSALPGADPYTGFFTLVLQNQGKILSEYPTIGYLLNAFWSPNGVSVAVNNRRGIDGDYLWVFSLKDGKALKKPDDGQAKAIADSASKKFPECDPRALDGSLTETLGWRNSIELVVQTRLFFHKKTTAINRTAVYRIDGDKLILASEEFARVEWPPSPGVTPTYYSAPVWADIAGIPKLFAAVTHEDKPGVQRLLEQGTDPNEKAHMGWTPLHEAVYVGEVEICRLLLDHGADVNARTGNNQKGSSVDWTPLFMAVSYGKEDIVAELLRYGAEVNITDQRGVTPMQLAGERKNTRIVALLQSASAK